MTILGDRFLAKQDLPAFKHTTNVEQYVAKSIQLINITLCHGRTVDD